MLLNAFAAIFEALGFCLAKYVIFQTPSIFDMAPVVAVILFIQLERKRREREREELNEKWQEIYKDHPFIRDAALKYPNDFPVAPIDKEN